MYKYSDPLLFYIVNLHYCGDWNQMGTFRFLVCNLAMADFFMGLYLGEFILYFYLGLYWVSIWATLASI